MTNLNLPINTFREEIVSTVGAHTVTIIQAETGAGKSTQVPQYLLAAGYEVVVTQPRRLAAAVLAERVAEEVGCTLGEAVGFRTARERLDSVDTRCLYVTDGLALVRELMSETTNLNRILILDEVHEWNMNIETLVAWVKAEIAAGCAYKLVLMSATLEATALSDYFDGAPVISVPGRLFEIEEQMPAATIIEDVARLVAEGRNVLVFLPGKTEIASMITELQLQHIAAEVLPLHGSLSAAEQQKCFLEYDRPKVIVSTNIAQTSITIDTIDAVVDSGMERRTELVNGVEGLYIRSISKSDAKQRRGRAGRTKPGIYINHCPDNNSLEFPVPEILRTHLDQTVLRLAMVGCDMETLSFFHQPLQAAITAARKILQSLGCMASDKTVTAIGQQVSQLPISVRPGRMIVEAAKLGVVGDLITAAAIFEIGELQARKDEAGNPTNKWKQLVSPGQVSDVITQLRLYKCAAQFKVADLHAKGIHPTTYRQVRELREHLERRIKLASSSTGDEKAIVKALVAGMADNLYRVRRGIPEIKNGQELGRIMLAGVDDRREPCRDSQVAFKDWVVGVPFDLEVSATGGTKVLHLLRMITTVPLDMLTEAAPASVKPSVGKSAHLAGGSKYQIN